MLTSRSRTERAYLLSSGSKPRTVKKVCGVLVGGDRWDKEWLMGRCVLSHRQIGGPARKVKDGRWSLASAM